ncbi:hypothetical protein P8C59_007102 [Phyllachora maydis]|uniref:Reverse transcriptase Ty1/copia-type domain-containing protein n=1 Tax=Phyllachora maydis TaxID=1825666 RepID=A0AAD9MDV8_9PEZI|nr:hypothetical protein P8C59_007102 [Phyllachora maydis]
MADQAKGKASVEDSISAKKNISSTLASLTNSSNAAAATTGKTSYSPRFDPLSSTIDLDSPLYPPRKEPYLGLAVNSAISNLDPPIDIGSKEGFKDTFTSSIVKELSKKAYTILDDRISNFFENPDISNTYSDSDQAVLLMLLCNSLSSSPRAAISRPIESKKEDVYNEFHALTFSTYRKGLSAFNAEFNGYLAKLTMAKIDIDPSLILNQYFKALESKFPSWASRQKSSIKQARMPGLIVSSLTIEYLIADILEESRNPAIEAYRAAYVANSSNSTSNSNSNPSKKGQLRPINTGNSPVSPASIGSITLEVLSRKAPPTYTKLVLDNVLYLPNIDINICNKIVVEIPSNSIRKEDFRPIIEDAIVSEAIEPKKRYKLRKSPAKGTTLEGIGPSLRGKRPYRPVEPLATAQAPYQSHYKTREPKPLTSTKDLPYMLREPVIEGNKVVEKAISSPTLKEPNIGLYLLKKTSSITKGLPNFNKIKEADFHCSSYNRGKAVRRVSKALIPNLPRVLDLIEGDTVKIRPRPYNRNPIVLLLVNRKMELVNSTAITNKETTSFQALFNELEPGIPYIPNLERYRAIGARGEAIIPLEKQSKSLKLTSRTEECKLLAVLGSKTYLLYIPSRRAVLKTSTIKLIEDNTVLSQPTNNTALEGELVDLDLDLEGAISPDPSNLHTKKPISIEIGPSKLKPYKSSSDSKLDKPLPDKPINPVIVESTRPTISIRKPELPEAFPRTIEPIFTPKPIEVIAPNQPITNKPLDNSDLISKGDRMQLDSYKPLAKTNLGVFYNAKTCHFIITHIDNCLFIGPDIGYITDLKKRLNKVYTIEDLGPAAYFLGWLSRSLNRPTKSYLNAAKNLFKYLNSTKDYSICFSYNGNTVADLRPKLSSSSNITIKLSRDFYSKEGPRPLTTTSTTIVDSRNGKGSSQTSIINSSLVPIGFSDSNFTEDQATSKSTYSYLYKLAGRPIS